MAQVINTNILSLNAQRNLNSSQGALQTSLQRLSSGLRINSAKDDAAGLAISERFTTQIRGLNQAVRNSNDGISLSQTAEGALAEVTSNLQRIRELAVQSRNGTNSASDRQALNAEVQQRISEVNRIASQTQFNGLDLLNGSFTGTTFQVGANQGQTITVNGIADVRGQTLGLAGGQEINVSTTHPGGPLTGPLLAGDLTLNGTDVGAVAQDASLIANAINALTGTTGVTAVATASSSGTDLNAFTTVTGTTLGLGTYSLSIGGVALVTAVDPEVTIIDDAFIDARIAANAAVLTAAGVTVSGSVADGDLAASKADGSNLDVVQTFGGDAALGFTTPGAGTTTFRGMVNLTSSANIVIGGNAPGTAGFIVGPLLAELGIAAATNVSTAVDADFAIGVIDGALTQVNGFRAQLGAIQNRFESVIASLSTTAENLTASRSRIMDTDFAAETAALTRAQILQQAGIAILAQANAQPQNVLALLR